MKNCLWKTYDFKADATVLLQAFKDEPAVFLLDSSLKSPRGRFSFLGFDPFETFQSKGRNSLEELRALFLKYRQATMRGPSPLGAGLVGYFGYDFGLHLENIPLKAKDDLNLPDCLFGFYDCILTIDHVAGKLYICSTGLPEKTGILREKRAARRLKAVERRLEGIIGAKPRQSAGFSPESFNDAADIAQYLKANFTKEAYKDAVRNVLEYIARGDIYQVNLSQRFTFDAKGFGGVPDAVRVYESLRRCSPASFAGYLDCGGFRILSSSPERFLRLEGNRVETCPMKGTRSRGRTLEEDRRLREELFKSPKDIAELLMITDLERNDLGRVCRYGSVKVKEMRALEEYQTVFQATSTIEGVLRDDKDCFDVIASCSPGGSITGCPKIRAMEIIEKLEGVRRGIYTGALGYVSFTGDMDFNILIRTLLLNRDKIYFHAGGGIVADSDPRKEYEETLIKARAMEMCLWDVFGFAGQRTFPADATCR